MLGCKLWVAWRDQKVWPWVVFFFQLDYGHLWVRWGMKDKLPILGQTLAIHGQIGGSLRFNPAHGVSVGLP